MSQFIAGCLVILLILSVIYVAYIKLFDGNVPKPIQLLFIAAALFGILDLLGL